MAGWGIGGSVELQTAGPKSIRSGSELPLIAPCRLLLMLTVLGFPVSGGIWMSGLAHM